MSPSLRFGVAAVVVFRDWSDVVRPGDRTPYIVSATQVPTAATFGGRAIIAPPPPSNNTDFWLQGVSFGVG
jgi:hypothetical protein